MTQKDIGKITDELTQLMKITEEQYIEEDFYLLNKDIHPQVIRQSIKLNLFNRITAYKGSKFEDYMNRYLRLK